MTKKIGRNSPCPCDSGKKYKYCCLAKDRAKNVRCVNKAQTLLPQASKVKDWAALSLLALVPELFEQGTETTIPAPSPTSVEEVWAMRRPIPLEKKETQ